MTDSINKKTTNLKINIFQSKKILEILSWIEDLNSSIKVSVSKKTFEINSYWNFDDKKSKIMNKNNSFFEINGLRYSNNSLSNFEQPILHQNEIGFLGLLSKKINNEYYFLIQAKIEPGNINLYQLSPTLQATKSNFEQKHGGKAPKFFDLFISDLNSIYDKLQTEHSSYFYRKRNRIKVIVIEEEIEIDTQFKWISFQDLIELSKFDNLLNMSLRSILGCFHYLACCKINSDLIHRAFDNLNIHLNVFKMKSNVESKFISLSNLEGWKVGKAGLKDTLRQSFFKISYFDVVIPHREVEKWEQPLIENYGYRDILLFTKLIDGENFYLVKITSEVGSFDIAEFGPTINLSTPQLTNDPLEKTLNSIYKSSSFDILIKSELSEEGGRFYHFSNYYSIVISNHDFDVEKRSNFQWVNKMTLSYLINQEGKANIYLRTFMLLIEAK